MNVCMCVCVYAQWVQMDLQAELSEALELVRTCFSIQSAQDKLRLEASPNAMGVCRNGVLDIPYVCMVLWLLLLLLFRVAVSRCRFYLHIASCCLMLFVVLHRSLRSQVQYMFSLSLSLSPGSSHEINLAEGIPSVLQREK